VCERRRRLLQTWRKTSPGGHPYDLLSVGGIVLIPIGLKLLDGRIHMSS
jgi:hypothetical protein